MKKNLIDSIEVLREYAPTVASLDMATFTVPLRIAQNQYIKPIIGKDCLNDLLEKLEDDSFEDVERELLEKLRSPLALVAQYNATPFNNITQTKGGYTVTKGEDYVPASRERVDHLQDALELAAQNEFNEVFEFLIDYGKEIASYNETDAQGKNLGNFINQTADFQKFTGIDIGHFIFHRLRPVMTRVEEQVIKTTLCTDLYEDLKEKVKTQAELGEYAPLLPLIQRAVVHITLLWALDEMNLSFSGNTLILKFRESISENINGKKSVDGAQLERIKQLNQREGIAAIDILKKNLEQNKADYPIYLASECNTAGNVPTPSQPTPGSGVYVGI